MSDLDGFLENRFVEFLPVSYTTADRFGRIAALLRKKGAPLPSNDIWIAAHAIESGAELLSFDRHFANIEGLVWTKLK
jgi:tRNA(fMet)-specific endonuclease VapC